MFGESQVGDLPLQTIDRAEHLLMAKGSGCTITVGSGLKMFALLRSGINLVLRVSPFPFPWSERRDTGNEVGLGSSVFGKRKTL